MTQFKIYYDLASEVTSRGECLAHLSRRKIEVLTSFKFFSSKEKIEK